MNSSNVFGCFSARHFKDIFVVVVVIPSTFNHMPPVPHGVPTSRSGAGASSIHVPPDDGNSEGTLYSDSYQRCLHEMDNPHCKYPLRRVVLGPLPSTLISSDTLIETAYRQGVPIDAINSAESSRGIGRSGASDNITSPQRVARLLGRQRSRSVRTSNTSRYSQALRRKVRSSSGDTARVYSPALPAHPHPPSMWVDIDDPLQSKEHIYPPKCEDLTASPTSITEYGTPERKPRPPPLKPVGLAHSISHDSLSRRSYRIARLRRVGSARRASSIRDFSESTWTSKSPKSASPVPLQIHEKWLSPEIQVALEESVGGYMDNMLWVGYSFEVGARFWRQFDHVHEFGTGRPRSGSQITGCTRTFSHSSGRPPTVFENTDVPVIPQRRIRHAAESQARRIVSPYVGTQMQYSSDDVESRAGWNEVSQRVDQVARIPRIRPVVHDPGLKSILRHKHEPESEPLPKHESEAHPATTPTSAPVVPQEAPPRPEKSSERPPSVASVVNRNPSRPPKSELRASPERESDQGSLESMPTETNENVVVESSRSSESDNFPTRAITRTRSLFNQAAPSVQHVTFAPRPTAAPSVNTLNTESATGASLGGHELASVIASRGRPVPVGRGDKDPVPALDVLARDDTPHLPEQSANWAQKVMQDENYMSQPVLKRDRMLVKVQTTTHENLPQLFDELESRRFEIRSYHWTEYMVALRPGRLELWSEATVRGRIFGDFEKLKLRHVIKLDPALVSLSLYSSADRLFCLTLARRSILSDLNQGRFNFLRSGSYIFIFHARMFTLAADWLWILWRELGGITPSHIFVHLPSLSMRIRMAVPELPSGDETKEYSPEVHENSALEAQISEKYSCVLPSRILQTVTELVYKWPNWVQLIRHAQSIGQKPRLMWRCGNICNWVTTDLAPDGSPRFWSVLVGEMLASWRHVSDLEVDLNWHYPSEARRPDGKLLIEPPSVEGFVWRLRPVAGTGQRVYLTVHENCIFMCRPSHAFAPDEFSGVSAELSSATRVPSCAEYIKQKSETFRAAEYARCQRQIRHSEGFVDLCDVEILRSTGTCAMLYTGVSRANINMVRKALQKNDFPYVEDDFAENALKSGYGDSTEDIAAQLHFPEELCAPDFDESNPGFDHAYVRSMRQFELVLGNGRIISFECHTPALAREWIINLFLLSRYWRCRRRIDTWNIMRITGTSSVLKQESPGSFDIRVTLSELWNWCLVDACRPIVYSGLLYWRKGNASLYKQRYVAIVDGRLVLFKSVHSTRSRVARQNEGILYKRIRTQYLLRDAYVYHARVGDRPSDVNGGTASGARRGARNQTAKRLPRLYSHGLYSQDNQEDCTFIVRTRLGYDRLSARQNMFRLRHSRREWEEDMIPGLADKAYGELVFCTRTVIERDVWIRAITLEIERLSRREAAREECIRNRGRVS